MTVPIQPLTNGKQWKIPSQNHLGTEQTVSRQHWLSHMYPKFQMKQLEANGFKMGSSPVPYWPMAIHKRALNYVYKQHTVVTHHIILWWWRQRGSLKQWMLAPNWWGWLPEKTLSHSIPAEASRKTDKNCNF